MRIFRCKLLFSNLLLTSIYLAVLLLEEAGVIMALVQCNTTEYCNLSYIRGSECISETGYCSNPFYKKGCLSYLQKQNVSIPQKSNVRVCSSSDPPDARIQGYCVPLVSHWNHTEIRLLGNNWESVFFETWIVQILLSEILGVPTSVETGFPDLSIDFYDEFDRFDYGKAYDWDGMRLASEIGDCRLVEQSQNASEYKSCAHTSLEVWEGQFHMTEVLKEEKVIENPSPLGVLGNAGWFIPLFTAARDPTLTSYLGMWGEENRQKLAETFKRPTTWLDYCREVSTTNCTVPDEFAMRPPINDTDEENQYFVAGLYTGYFRKTTENDCETWPTNCTGHFVDFPCGWSSFFEQQAYHLGIALQSSGSEPYCKGYPYSRMLEIWHAANATKSDVMMFYWTPEALVQLYAGTEAEFQKVSLPLPTQACFESRVQTSDRCNPNRTIRLGKSEGVCDQQPHTLMKFVTSNLYDITKNPSLSEALHSPAYDALKNFQINGLQLGSVFDKWLKSSGLSNNAKNDSFVDTDRITGPREAVCKWVGENYDVLQTFVPRTYPRIDVHGEDTLKEPLFYVSLICASAALAFTLIVFSIMYKRRKWRIMIIAQVEFLFLLLIGLTFVQLGSLALAVPPSNGTCVLAVWAIYLGYTLELIPLIVKIAAINTLMAAARQMKRIKIERSGLFARVAMVTGVMAIYLLVWTLLDPFDETYEYKLTDDMNDDGDTIVKVYTFCQSDSPYWNLGALVWRTLLLILATVLAFQSRKSPVNFNESHTLAVMMYSQFSFLIWTIILFAIQANLSVTSISRYQSLIQSLDVTAVLCIYFVPKLSTTDELFRQRNGHVRQSVFNSSNTPPHSTAAMGNSTCYDDNSVGSQSYEGLAPRIRFSGTGSEIIPPDLHGDLHVSAYDTNKDGPRGSMSTFNETGSVHEDRNNAARLFGSNPLLSNFELLQDHVRFSVLYRNFSGDNEVVQVKCFDDASKTECYREEEKLISGDGDIEQENAITQVEKVESAANIQYVSFALERAISTRMLSNHSSSSFPRKDGQLSQDSNDQDTNDVSESKTEDDMVEKDVDRSASSDVNEEALLNRLVGRKI